VEYFEPKSASSRLHNRQKIFQLTCEDSREMSKFCTKIKTMCAKANTMLLFNDKMIESIFLQLKKLISAEKLKRYCAITQKIVKMIEDFDKIAVMLGGIPSAFKTITTIIKNDANADYQSSKEMIINHARKLVLDQVSLSESINRIENPSNGSNTHGNFGCSQGRGHRGHGNQGCGHGQDTQFAVTDHPSLS
jgi:hypothetical protein